MSGEGHAFLSYSHTPADRAYVDRLARFLEKRGVRVWYDQGLTAGEQWNDILAEKIDTCSAFVVVMTAAAERPGGWVKREITRAQQRRRTILPLLLDGEVFFELNTTQYESVVGGQLPPDRFVLRLRRLCAVPDGDALPVTGAGVWAMQSPGPDLIPRPDLAEPLVAQLTGLVGSRVAVTAAVHGAGGFGKTTLVRQVCADPRVRQHFRDGVWTTIGERVTGAALAEKVNGVYQLLTGDRPTFTDPDEAGQHLGALLEQRVNVLLVVDDVWDAEALAPFLQGGVDTCTRLITTRRMSVLESALRQEPLRVDQMTADQAHALLARDLSAVDGYDLSPLIELTGRWWCPRGVCSTPDPVRLGQRAAARLCAGTTAC